MAHLLLSVPACLLPTIGQTQPAGAIGEDFIYDVQSGDTLLKLSKQYTDDPTNWRELQRLNIVQDVTLLPIGMALKIPFTMIPVVQVQALVTHVAGAVTINGQTANNGDALKEGDRIHTGPNGFLTLELADSSTLTIPADSTGRLERVRMFRDAGLTDTVLTLEEGSLESEVAPLHGGVGRFEVRTPVTITGVRGTRLRVRSEAKGSQIDVLAGVADLGIPGRAEQTRLSEGQGSAVDAKGRWLGIRQLIPAPTLSTPTVGDKGFTLSFAPVPDAIAYLVRVASDPAGSRLYSSERFVKPEITFRAPRSGTYYLLVRSIDEDGVMGPDATLSFFGQRILRTGDGSAVTTTFDHPVLLPNY